MLRAKTVTWISKRLVGAALLVAGASLGANADIPEELYQALGIDRSASPKVLYEALEKRYRDPDQGAGKGEFGDLWEPIPMSKYFDPATFYTPPTSVKDVSDGAGCIKCHAEETPGWVRDWKKSVHGNLNTIRNLSEGDPRYYKKALLQKIEGNLRSMGKLGKNEQLTQVGCIDCHVGIGAETGDHRKDLRLPDAAVCGTCHLQQFAEIESERDTQTWPNDEWPKGRPSHALDYRANVETGIYAGMAEREIADGCTACHSVQNKCDSCHTRHKFSSAEARKPEACQLCHSGIDHNNYTNYMFSKHGQRYQSAGAEWNWEVQLKDAFAKGRQSAPTCATCHMENKGKYGHNVVRKVRWANYPGAGGIAENITSDWAEKRKEAWIGTCSNCHSERFSRAYFDMIDGATLAGVKKYREAAAVVEKLYEDGLLPGQKTNRPAPPKPKKDGPAQFFQLFWAEGNNPTVPEVKLLEIGENDLAKLHVGVAHVNPGNWTYTEGWEPLLGKYTEIMQADTQLREMAALKEKVAKLEGMQKGDLFDLNRPLRKASFAGIGGGMVLIGFWILWSWRRNRRFAGPPRA